MSARSLGGFKTRYIVIRQVNGMTANYQVTMLGHIQVPVAQGSTFAAGCGNPPGFGANFKRITLDQ
jgi:hypothetical protein